MISAQVISICGIYWHLRSIFVSGTYLAIMCAVSVAVMCILLHMCKNVGYMCPFSIIFVQVTFVM